MRVDPLGPKTGWAGHCSTFIGPSIKRERRIRGVLCRVLTDPMYRPNTYEVRISCRLGQLNQLEYSTVQYSNSDRWVGGLALYRENESCGQPKPYTFSRPACVEGTVRGMFWGCLVVGHMPLKALE